MELQEFKFPDDWVEKPKGRSETIPHQALSIYELLERSLRGQDIPSFDLPDDEDEDIDRPEVDVEDKFEAFDRLSYYEQRYMAMKDAQDRKEKEQRNMAMKDAQDSKEKEQRTKEEQKSVSDDSTSSPNSKN